MLPRAIVGGACAARFGCAASAAPYAALLIVLRPRGAQLACCAPDAPYACLHTHRAPRSRRTIGVRAA
eukprot:9876223-Alexandrium_andersonii.AAC.1